MKRPPSPAPSVTTQDHDESFHDDHGSLRPAKKARPSSPSGTIKRVTFACGPARQLDDDNNIHEEDHCDTVLPQHEGKGYPSMFQTLTLDDINRLWYQQHDLANAKEYTRALILKSRADHSGLSCPLLGADEEEETISCGLRKYTNERMQHKKSAIWYVMAASREYYTNPEFIKAVSERCTGWARQVAYHEAMALYKDLYGSSDETEPDVTEEDDTTTTTANGSTVSSWLPCSSTVLVTPPASPKHVGA